MYSLYDRVNYKKQLVDKSKNYFDFDILDEQYRKFIDGFFRGTISEKDKVILYASKAYSDLNRLLHLNDGKITMPRNIVLGESVSNMADEMEKDPNLYLAYFNSLLSMGNGVLTVSELKERVARFFTLPEFSEEQSPEIKRQKVCALYAASGTLTEIIEENNGVLKNTDRLRDIESKTFYAKKASLEELSDEDRNLYERLNQAKINGIKNFLPVILLKPQNGVISIDSVQEEYNRLLGLEVFGPNMDFKTKVEFEKIYAAIQYTLLERDGAIDYNSRDLIFRDYFKNISKVEGEATISAILSSRDSFSEESLAELFGESMKKDETDEIKAKETSVDFEIAYCAIVNEIKRRGGSCSSKEAKEAYKRALDTIERYRVDYRKRTRSPFLVFPKHEPGKEDEIYLSLLNETTTNMEENASTNNIEWLCESVGRIKAIRELYDIIKNPIKRRELDDVKYEVNARESITGAEVCELQYLKNAENSSIVTIENSAGDEIEVIELGKLGYATLRQPNGKPTFTDSMTIKEYEIKKTYLSEQEKDAAPLARTFRVFSPRIDGSLILKDKTIQKIYADQIFSDMSLEAALEFNGGAIATVEYSRTDKGLVPQISFDENMVGACRKMNRMLDEYAEAEDKKGVKRFFAKKIQNGSLVGNSNIPLSNGYASKIMGHTNGSISENDVLFAFEWSDIEKKRTIFDLIARSRVLDKR